MCIHVFNRQAIDENLSGSSGHAQGTKEACQNGISMAVAASQQTILTHTHAHTCTHTHTHIYLQTERDRRKEVRKQDKKKERKTKRKHERGKERKRKRKKEPIYVEQRLFSAEHMDHGQAHI